MKSLAPALALGLLLGGCGVNEKTSDLQQEKLVLDLRHRCRPRPPSPAAFREVAAIHPLPGGCRGIVPLAR